jgi:uncharacterized protein (DUF885 family)
MEALTLHEAVPGHHLQIALAQEQEALPEFRKWSLYTAFVEGWGLYAESLGSELGMYQDPYSNRLVLDTGIHSQGWTRERAIEYFVGVQDRRAELEELRSTAQSELGEKFDIRKFHDTVLGNGAMPLSTLEVQVRSWIAAQKRLTNR